MRRGRLTPYERFAFQQKPPNVFWAFAVIGLCFAVGFLAAWEIYGF